MAKIFKIEMYVVDYGDSGITSDEIEEAVRSDFDAIVFVSNAKEKEFEWNDDLKINLIDSTKEDYEEYFTEQSENLWL